MAKKDGWTDREVAGLMERMIVLGGVPGVGYMTNPETKNHPGYIEVNGEKVVCTAQGGECREFGPYYTGSLNDSRSWVTPIIQQTCTDRCPYKNLVCDDHQHDEGENVRTFIPYPQYNKFHGQFRSYCRCVDRLHTQPKET